MHTNWKNRSQEEGFNYWPAFADMAAATCMMLVIFWIAGVLELGGSREKVAKLNAEIERLRKLVGKESILDARIRDLEKELADQKSAYLRLKEDLAESERKRKAAEEALAKSPTNEPPNMVLKQDESFVFPSLQATVPQDFKERFKKEKRDAVIKALNSPSNIEVIEIIGHTDNRQVGGKSNVDTNLEAVYAGNKDVRDLAFGSNCELGLGRAIAVKSMLEEFLRELSAGSHPTHEGEEKLTPAGKDRIRNLTFRTYSAAQLFPTDPARPGRDEDRRIEIRFTRLRKTSETNDDLRKSE